jgi:Na+/H+ antiporter NhaC
MENKHIRIIFGSIFTSILIFGIIFALLNFDELFKNEVRIKYSTGCSEKYINGKLVTPECERLLIQQEEKTNWIIDPMLIPNLSNQ